jgi:sugar phosphate isomerase/epimerase
VINRREFLVSSMAALYCSSQRSLAAAIPRPLGVQLYTVRHQAEKDLPDVLAAIRQIGYEEVETYGDMYSRPAAELKRLVHDHGLRVPSGHFEYDEIESKLEYAAALGVDYIICPDLPEPMWTSLDGFKQGADQFNKWGEQIRRMGMRFGFHNHNYEFRRFGDTTGFDVLISRSDPNLVSLEMDCYWIVQAGQDPLQMFSRLGGRIKMLHLKDRKPGYQVSLTPNNSSMHMTPVGAGTINWKAILDAAQRNGVQHLFVEQDEGDLPPLKELAISYRNLQPLLL